MIVVLLFSLSFRGAVYCLLSWWRLCCVLVWFDVLVSMVGDVVCVMMLFMVPFMCWCLFCVCQLV